MDASDAVAEVPADDAALAAEALLVVADEEAAALSVEEAALDVDAAVLSDEDASLDADSVDADEALPDAFDDVLADELQAHSPITKMARIEQRNTTTERFMATSPSNRQTGRSIPEGNFNFHSHGIDSLTCFPALFGFLGLGSPNGNETKCANSQQIGVEQIGNDLEWSHGQSDSCGSGTGI